jgi:hypothetical protein
MATWQTPTSIGKSCARVAQDLFRSRVSARNYRSYKALQQGFVGLGGGETNGTITIAEGILRARRSPTTARTGLIRPSNVAGGRDRYPGAAR